MTQKNSGFSEAELAAAAWQRQTILEDGRTNESIRHRSTKRRDNVSEEQECKRAKSVSLSNTIRTKKNTLNIPEDPHNPLFAAYEKPYHKRSHRSQYKRDRHREHSTSRRSHRKSRVGYLRSDMVEDYSKHKNKKVYDDLDPSTDSSRWIHDSFYLRSQSPNRERTSGSMWDTRKGAWRSRAGGVCLPPSPPPSPQNNDDINEAATIVSDEPARYKHRWGIQSKRQLTQRYFSNGRGHPRSRSASIEHTDRLKERDSPVYD